MYFDVSLCSSCLQVESREVGRFGSGRIDFGKLLRRRAVLFRAAEPDEVGELDASAEEVVASVDTEDCAEPVLKVILQISEVVLTSRRFDIPSVQARD